jgi:hypothetical protein
MKRLALAIVALTLIGLTGQVRAAEDPTGTWKWSVTFNDQTREQTVKLKLDGDKLTGAMLGRNNQETAIENATFKDDTVSFAVTRERGGRKSTTKFSGKVAGDTIKGKQESERGGNVRSVDWEAKRSK